MTIKFQNKINAQFFDFYPINNKFMNLYKF